MNWILAGGVAIAACIAATFVVRRADTDEAGRTSVIAPMLTMLTGAALGIFYFGLDYVLSTITDLPPSGADLTVFSHTAAETVCVTVIAFWLVFVGAWTLIVRSDYNQTITNRKVADLERQLALVTATTDTGVTNQSTLLTIPRTK